MNGGLSQHDDHTADQQTAVKTGLDPSIHHHSQRNGNSTHQKISHSQRHHKTEGGLTESPARADRPDDQHISNATSYSDEDLQERVDHLLAVRHHAEEGRTQEELRGGGGGEIERSDVLFIRKHTQQILESECF